MAQQQEPTQLATIQHWASYLNGRAKRLDVWCNATGLDSATMVRVALRELCGADKRAAALRKCTPQSVFLSLVNAAYLGLEPSGGLLGEAYLIPFKEQCTLLPGYQGLVKLVRQSDQVEAVWADVVYGSDVFRVHRGSKPELIHEPSLHLPSEERGDIIAAYACARFKGGDFVQFDALSRDEVDKARKVSRASDYGPWAEWFSEMAKKTAVRRLCKYLPKSARVRRAIEADAASQNGDVIDVTGTESVAMPEPGAEETQSKTEQLKQQLQEQAQ